MAPSAAELDAALHRAALTRLRRREYSRAELRDILAALSARLAPGHDGGPDGGGVERALAALERRGYLSDARFAEQLAVARMAGGYGPLRIRAELGARGVDETLIEATLASNGDCAELAAEILDKRFGAAPPQSDADRARRARFLCRRGFDDEFVDALLAS